MSSAGDTYTPTDKSTRALLIFGMDGKQQHTYQYDSNKHRLFTLPHRITTKSHGFPGGTRMMTLRRMVLFLLTLSRVLYLNCYHQTEVCHCLMSMSCHRYNKKSVLMDGKQQHTYQYDSNKHRLFTRPRRITTNNNKDIVVVDRTDHQVL
jgi:hypothetical protein